MGSTGVSPSGPLQSGHWTKSRCQKLLAMPIRSCCAWLMRIEGRWSVKTNVPRWPKCRNPLRPAKEEHVVDTKPYPTALRTCEIGTMSPQRGVLKVQMNLDIAKRIFPSTCGPWSLTIQEFVSISGTHNANFTQPHPAPGALWNGTKQEVSRFRSPRIEKVS